MTEEERRALLADEWLIIRDSGEIPEITFHSSLYFLTEEKDGPCLVLADEEIRNLQNAAIQRYNEIILRDITLENYHKTIYRGVRRSLYNWYRYQAFLLRQSVVDAAFLETGRKALLHFLEQGVASAGQELPEKFINCSLEELLELAGAFGVSPGRLPANIAQFCVQNPQDTEP